MRKKKFILTTILIIILLTITVKSDNFISDYFRQIIIDMVIKTLNDATDNNDYFVYHNEKRNSTNYLFIPKTVEEGIKDNLSRFEELPLEHQIKIYNQLSKFYYNRGIFELSNIFIKKAIIKDNKCYECYITRGILHMQNNNLLEAIKDFNYSISIKKSSEAYYNRYLLYFNHLNSKEKALADLNTAIKINEDHIKSRYSLFFIYAKDNNILKAKEILEKINKNLLLKKNYTSNEIIEINNIFNDILNYLQNKSTDNEIALENSIIAFLFNENIPLYYEEYHLFLSELERFINKINNDQIKEILKNLLEIKKNETIENYIASLRKLSI